MDKTYRVAIIGTGRMGGLIEDEIGVGDPGRPYGHFSAYQAIEQTEVVAVANRGAERMRRFCERFGVTNTYPDYREMIEQERPDIVSVTTPSFARAEPLIFAAEHGVRGIYSEKGLCASLAEADRIRAAMKANGVAFNWGASRRHKLVYRQLREAIARGDIGEPKFVVTYVYTDLIKHHPHTLDTASMLLGDPAPLWVEGRLIDPGDPFDPTPYRPMPSYDEEGHRFVPAEGREIGDPMVGFFRVGYSGGIECFLIPQRGIWEIEVHGSEGRACAWEDGTRAFTRHSVRGEEEVREVSFHPLGESPTISTIRDIIRELETGERTSGNIDVTMQSVEVQFGIAHSHLQGGARQALPVEDRSLHVPGG
jgi:predicted dehydrogenase